MKFIYESNEWMNEINERMKWIKECNKWKN